MVFVTIFRNDEFAVFYVGNGGAHTARAFAKIHFIHELIVTDDFLFVVAGFCANGYSFYMNERIDFAFLDSGTGGIPYMLALKEKCPNAHCVYLGDTAHFPYGEKSPKLVADCASEAVNLINRLWNPRAIVIACNTISVTALDLLRARFPNLPLVGTVPAIKLAAKLSKNRKIGLLATKATVSNPYTDKLCADFASDCTVFRRGDSNLVRFIEEKFFTSTKDERKEACRGAIEFFAQNDCDVIVLACTHFTHIATDFAEFAGKGVLIVDSRDGVAKQALRVCPLDENADKKTFLQDCAFFVTKADSRAIEEYKTLCKNCKIPWGGIV